MQALARPHSIIRILRVFGVSPICYAPFSHVATHFFLPERVNSAALTLGHVVWSLKMKDNTYFSNHYIGIVPGKFWDYFPYFNSSNEV